MKFSRNFMALLCLLSLSFLPATKAAESVNVNGFLVDAAVINHFLNNGAANVKVYAAANDLGDIYYVIVGADENFKTMPGQAYMQNYRGNCPPTCEFMPAQLQGGNSYVESAEAMAFINNYKNSRTGVMNCVKLTQATLDKIRTTYPFMKIMFGSSVTITGLNEDGSTGKRSTYTETGNASCSCDM